MKKTLKEMTNEELLNEYDKRKKVCDIYKDCYDGSYEMMWCNTVTPVEEEMELRGLTK